MRKEVRPSRDTVSQGAVETSVCWAFVKILGCYCFDGGESGEGCGIEGGEGVGLRDEGGGCGAEALEYVLGVGGCVDVIGGGVLGEEGEGAFVGVCKRVGKDVRRGFFLQKAGSLGGGRWVDVLDPKIIGTFAPA